MFNLSSSYFCAPLPLAYIMYHTYRVEFTVDRFITYFRSYEAAVPSRMPLPAWSQNGAGAGMLISIFQLACADLMLAYADLLVSFVVDSTTFLSQDN